MSEWLRMIRTTSCMVVMLSCVVQAGDRRPQRPNDPNLGEQIQGRIDRIVDGDTVRFIPARSTPTKFPTIRMVGIDTPETHYPTPDGKMHSQGYWGDAAAAYLAKLVPPGTAIVLQNTGFDKYGRVLGRLFFKDNDVNLKMVREGWAIPYIYCTGPDCNATYLERHNVIDYVRACYSARREGKGIHNPSKPLPELPYDFRRRLMGDAPQKWVGDFATKELFNPDQYTKIDPCRRVFFATREEAARAGFR